MEKDTCQGIIEKLAGDKGVTVDQAGPFLKKLVDKIKAAESRPVNHEAEMYKAADADELAAHCIAAVREELMKYGDVYKDAGPGSKIGAWLKPTAPMLAAIGVTLGVGELRNLLRSVHSSKKVERSREWLKRNDPELAKDPKFNFYFNTLKDFAPHVAANPLSAIPILQEMKEWGYVGQNTINAITKIEQTLGGIEKQEHEAGRAFEEAAAKRMQLMGSIGELFGEPGAGPSAGGGGTS